MKFSPARLIAFITLLSFCWGCGVQWGGITSLKQSNILVPHWSVLAKATSGNGQFTLPSGFAIDNSGNSYISDNGHNLVMKFDITETLLPSGVALASPTVCLRAATV